MTDKEREKMKVDVYLGEYVTIPVNEKDAAKMLAKELRKSLGKKGYQVEKDELFCEERVDGREGYGDFRYSVDYTLDAMLESFEVTGAFAKEWAENNLSVLKTAKEDKEFKKFAKAVKKHLKEAGRYAEPEEGRGAEPER